MFGKIMQYKETQNGIEIQFEHKVGRVSVLPNNIIRVFAAQTGKEYPSEAVENRPQALNGFPIELDKGVLTVRTPELIIEVREDFHITFLKTDGTILCKDTYRKIKKDDVVHPDDTSLLEKEGHHARACMSHHTIEIVKEMAGDEHFYGLGDKTGFLDKRGYAYEMWNTDNPAPQVDFFTRLYKSIPFFLTLRQNGCYGIFFDNTYHSWFDMGKESDDYYYFAADGGNLDYYFFAGNTLSDILKGYTSLTGTTPLPQLWTLGYHQSRWGYVTEEDIWDIADHMRELNIPCDVIHMDIDYMQDYKVFTWNKRYSNPKKTLEKLADRGFKIVTIIDPGVKKEEGYEVYDEGVKNGYFAKTKDDEIYVNEVWPGDAVYPDFSNPSVQKWWSEKQKFLIDMGVRGVWNDMNEPASFRGEIPEDVVFTKEGETPTDHAEIHNIYGHLMSKAAYCGFKKYDERRPFVITRACYAGTQKYSTAWTGDNQSIWAHLQMAIPQLCNLGLSGMSYVGTDVGGFGSDTTKELLIRWVELGCLSPLFRNHSAMGTREQEPWQFDEETLNIYRKYVKLRYQLLPYLYDNFYLGEQTGTPVFKPLVLNYQSDPEVQTMNDEFLIGDHLLCAPVVTQGTTKRMVYLPKGDWYDYYTHEFFAGNQYLIREAPLDVMPLFVRAGTILPLYPVQQYVGEKTISNLTLEIFPGNGIHLHYQDDGESFDYQKGGYNEYRFELNTDRLLTIQLVHQGYKPIYHGFHIRCQGKEEYVKLDGKILSISL